MSTFTERINLALEASGQTQATLARASRVSKPSVNDWLSGKTKALKAETLVLAAEFLNVRPRWLALGEGPMRDGQPFTVGEPPAPYGRPAWPFPQLSETWVANLPPEQLAGLQRVLVATAEALSPAAEKQRRA
jgi:transcriptional regulator with XRE-family HTH domain